MSPDPTWFLFRAPVNPTTILNLLTNNKVATEENQKWVQYEAGERVK